jgi:intein/homing endonuclease
MKETLPKSKKMFLEKISSENLNKELAYLLGVYLTDGCITSRDKPTPNCIFSMGCIDKDFADETLRCVKHLIPSCKANVNKYNYKPSGFCKKSIVKYFFGAGFTMYKNFFLEQTGEKHHIPSVIWEAPLDIKKEFIAGVMDGDGWISISEKGRLNPRISIGIGGISEGWVWEFKILLEKMGVSVNKPDLVNAGYREHTQPFVRFHFNVRSFIEKGLYFKIERKKRKLLKSIEILKEIKERKHY